MIDLKILAPQSIKYFGDLHPFFKWNKNLRDAGINLEIFYDHTNRGLLNADHLIIHHRYFKNESIKSLENPTENNYFISQLKALKANTGNLIWFDADDSSGSAQFPVMPFVDVFVKKQVLKDKDQYLGKPGERKNMMVWSDQTVEQKNFIPCAPDQLHKIKVGWNIAYNDYRDFVVHFRLRKYLSRFLSYNLLPLKFTSASAPRNFDISFRGTINYSKNSPSTQRNQVLELFKTLPYKLASGGNVSRSEYLKELNKSKISISPFGLGEVCFRDYETFISGALLIKPTMDHLDTSPDLFIANKTYVPVSWDLSDLRETFDRVLENYAFYKEIAANGQELYKKTIEAPDTFINSVKRVIS